MIVKREISITIAPREDGGLRVWSDDLPGLVLSHSDQELVLKDLGSAVMAILTHHTVAAREAAIEAAKAETA